MRYRLATLTLLAVCLVAVGGCANPLANIFGHFDTTPDVSNTVTALSGTSWTLMRFSAHGVAQTLVPTAPITLQFQSRGTTYIGSSGCNYYNGTYAITGMQLRLRFESVTEKACAGPIMSQEVTYLNVLEHVHQYQRAGQLLTLQDSSDMVVFTEANSGNP